MRTTRGWQTVARNYRQCSETREYAPFYASLEIAVLAIEAIRVVIQITLRTERRTYVIHIPIPRVFIFPIFYQAGKGMNSMCKVLL
jgi:hypothetical protein